MTLHVRNVNFTFTDDEIDELIEARKDERLAWVKSISTTTETDINNAQKAISDAKKKMAELDDKIKSSNPDPNIFKKMDPADTKLIYDLEKIIADSEMVIHLYEQKKAWQAFYDVYYYGSEWYRDMKEILLTKGKLGL